ncbi:MAG: ABC transporter substrate-binding protein [Bacteroidales bacterium]|nr:ABC transporter substrate-binding protein [Bacteroidales bacterium]
MVRKFLLPVLLLLTVASARAQERLVFTPQWTAQAQFAGYYVAQELGFYKDAGIDVEIVHPTATLSAMSRISRNQSQATTMQICQAMEIVDSGTPLVNILQTSMNNAMVIASRRNVNPLSQKGARVGIWSAGFGQLAICMSQKDSLDYEWVRFATNVNLFVKGAIDATLAMSYNEYYQIVQAGYKLDSTNVYRFRDHGYNVQEDGVYVTRAYYRKHKDVARKFADASRKGWEWAAEHPEETLDIVMKYVKENHIATNRVLQRLMLEEVLSLQVDRESGEREFRVRPDMVKLASDLMVECKMLRHEVTYGQLTED